MLAWALGGFTTAGCSDDDSSTSGVGRACVDATECSGTLVCLTDFPGGYCSEACDENTPCEGAACVEGVCLALCASVDDCREGYQCVSAGNQRVCAPPGQGFAGIGDNCTSAGDCQAGLTCETLSRGGMQCTRDCASVLNCGVNAVCVDSKCRRTCTRATDCDANQECVSTPEGQICEPVEPASPLGGPCADDTDCEGELTCLTDAPDGYCTKDCINQAACDGGVCHEGFCFAGCTPAGGPMDFLFIVDDSGGMDQFHQSLISASGSLFDSLATADIDYRIGVVTTDVDVGGHNVSNCRNLGGELQTTVGPPPCEAPPDAWITPTNVADPASTFSCIINALGATGCGFEQPFEALQRAVSEAVNPGFIRQDALLVVVVVTTEDDCSAREQSIFDPNASQYGDFVSYRCFQYGISCDGSAGSFTNCETKSAGQGGVLYPIARFTSQLEAVKGNLDRVEMVAVAGPATPVTAGLDGNNQMTLNSSCPGGVPDAQPGIRIAELLDAFSGHFVSICSGMSGAWNPILDQISGSGCRPGYRCSEEIEGNICEPE